MVHEYFQNQLYGEIHVQNIRTLEDMSWYRFKILNKKDFLVTQFWGHRKALGTLDLSVRKKFWKGIGVEGGSGGGGGRKRKRRAVGQLGDNRVRVHEN